MRSEHNAGGEQKSAVVPAYVDSSAKSTRCEGTRGGGAGSEYAAICGGSLLGEGWLPVFEGRREIGIQLSNSCFPGFFFFARYAAHQREPSNKEPSNPLATVSSLPRWVRRAKSEGEPSGEEEREGGLTTRRAA